LSQQLRTEELIQELAENLEPVRPIPPLRQVLVAILALWAAVACLGLLVLGTRPDLLDLVLAWRGAGAVFAGLGLAGLGGLIAALALAVPGREATVRAGLALGLVGMALAAGAGTLMLLRSPVVGEHAPLSGDLRCLGVACGVAFLPALAVVSLGGRAAPLRPLFLAWAAAAGTAALGAVVAQASCPFSDPQHIMWAHILAPGVGAVLLTLPLLWVLRRVVRR